MVIVISPETAEQFYTAVMTYYNQARESHEAPS